MNGDIRMVIVGCSYLSEISERGYKFRIMINDGELDVEIEDLPDGVEEHGQDDGGHNTQ